MNEIPRYPNAPVEDRAVFGMWIYLMSDCLLFASLFAVYLVLHHNTNGGPGSSQLFSLPVAFLETVVLLASSTLIGLSAVLARAGEKRAALALAFGTLVFGLIFLGVEITDFVQLAHSGNSWSRSGFLSGFFGLVGTHGLHVALGSLWLIAIIAAIALRGLTEKNIRMLSVFALFWHFIDLIWIFIFSIVYLLGAL